MVYKRKGGHLFSFQARTRTGWHPMTAPTTSKALASRMAGMWETLAVEHRAWDLLQPILDEKNRRLRRQKMGALWDAWDASGGDPVETHRRLLIPVKTSTRDPAADVVYFIRNRASGLVKIGLTNNLARRLTEIQMHGGAEVEALGYVQGSYALERELHHRWRSHRVLGEWFHPTPDLMAWAAMSLLPFDQSGGPN